MAANFAICTFRATGPIKTWSDLRGANVHNARTKPIEHGIPGAPPPEHLIGTEDLVADVKLHLRAAGLDPTRLRKNGVIAYEAIMTAFPDFFDVGSEAERAARLRAWTDAQVAFARKRWGNHRVVSMVLHVDEKTPHIHLVVLPLERKADARLRDGRERYSLVGRTISGPGRFDQLQDDYAAAMEPFGLVRGVKGSGRKNEPVPVYLARLAAKEHEVDVLRAALMRDREALAAERAELARIKADMGRDQRRVIEAAAEAGRRKLAAWRVQTEADRNARDIESERSAWTVERAYAEADLAKRKDSHVQFREDLIASRERLVPIFEAAKAFTAAAVGLKVDDIVAVARPAVASARKMLEVSRAVQPPSVAQQPSMQSHHAGRC